MPKALIRTFNSNILTTIQPLGINNTRTQIEKNISGIQKN